MKARQSTLRSPMVVHMGREYRPGARPSAPLRHVNGMVDTRVRRGYGGGNELPAVARQPSALNTEGSSRDPSRLLTVSTAMPAPETVEEGRAERDHIISNIPEPA